MDIEEDKKCFCISLIGKVIFVILKMLKKFEGYEIGEEGYLD